MRNAVRLLLFTLLFLTGQQELCASLPKTRVGKNLSLAALPCREEAVQVPELRLDNPLLYGESVRGIKLWTKFDPEGLWEDDGSGFGTMEPAAQAAYINGITSDSIARFFTSVVKAATYPLRLWPDYVSSGGDPSGAIQGVSNMALGGIPHMVDVESRGNLQEEKQFAQDAKKLVTTPEGLGTLAVGVAAAKFLPQLAPEGSAAVTTGESLIRVATEQPRGGNGLVLADGEGATPAEIAASTGGPTGGSRAGQGSVRASLIQAQADGNGLLTCWRCGATSTNPMDFHLGHRNVPTSLGGNLSDANVAIEGAACNLSAGNRGAPSPGMSCAERGGPGAPYGRTTDTTPEDNE